MPECISVHLCRVCCVLVITRVLIILSMVLTTKELHPSLNCREALWLNFWLKKTLILHCFLFVVSSHLRFGLVWCCSARRNGRELWVVHRNSQFTQFFGNAQHSYRCTVVHSRMSKKLVCE